jgi:hypothetical protein
MKTLATYSGTWGEPQVRHLLRRTMFGANQADVDFFLKLGFSKSIEQLFTIQKPISPPLNNYSAVGEADELGIKYAETWIKSTGNGGIDFQRRSSMKSWLTGNQIHQERSLEEKMLLFWHNHFATEMNIVNDSRFCYSHFEMMRKATFGNFKKLVKDISVDPMMLVYLNGSVNTKSAPDENYGRELQELFTVGKGLQNRYTEDDVKAAARILTGYRHKRDTITYTFNAANHDATDKQFSAFYGNKVIKGETGADGQKELDALIDMLFEQPEVAKHICRKLYRFFVYFDITAETEKLVIEPLANIFRQNQYNIKPVLEKLFMSEHFFDVAYFGAMIKSPIDHLVGFVRDLEIKFPESSKFVAQYNHWKWIRDKARDASQDVGDPPNVSGWQAYYQSPQFYELWVNTDTFPKRTETTDRLLLNGRAADGFTLVADLVKLVETFKNPSDPNDLINEATARLLVLDFDQQVKTGLKIDILLAGQSADYYWSDVWKERSFNTLAKKRLQDLFKFITSSAEYQLM